VNAPADETEADVLHRTATRQVPLLHHLKIQLKNLEPGKAVFELAVAEPHLRTHGILHGGVVATLLDTAMGYAAVSVAPADFNVVTIQINVNFVKAVLLGETILTTGEVQHRGRQTAVARGEIRNANNQLVAAGTATFMFVKIPTPADAPMTTATSLSEPEADGAAPAVIADSTVTDDATTLPPTSP